MLRLRRKHGWGAVPGGANRSPRPTAEHGRGEWQLRPARFFRRVLEAFGLVQARGWLVDAVCGPEPKAPTYQQPEQSGAA